MPLAPLGLRRGTTAPVTAEVRVIAAGPRDRRVMWVETGGVTASGFRGVPLSSTIAAVVEQAAHGRAAPSGCRS